MSLKLHSYCTWQPLQASHASTSLFPFLGAGNPCSGIGYRFRGSMPCPPESIKSAHQRSTCQSMIEQLPCLCAGVVWKWVHYPAATADAAHRVVPLRASFLQPSSWSECVVGCRRQTFGLQMNHVTALCELLCLLRRHLQRSDMWMAAKVVFAFPLPLIISDSFALSHDMACTERSIHRRQL